MSEDVAAAPKTAPGVLARWRARLTLESRRGLIEAVTALLVAVIVLATYDRESRDMVGLVLELNIAVFAAAVGRWPRAAAVIIGVLLTTLLLVPTYHPRYSILAAYIPLVSLGVRGHPWVRTLVTIWYLVVAGVMEADPPLTWASFVSGVLGWFLLAVFSWVAGSSINLLRMDREEVEQAQADALRAERRSIARDLHDTVAYSTTTMIMRAEQAKLRGVANGELAADLDFIIAAGRNSLRDLRGLLEALRRNDPDIPEAPRSPWRIAPLAEVVAERARHLTSLGFRVTTLLEADVTRLPDSIKETLAKVVVEATSNMVKHARPGSPCRIMVETTDEDATAVFVNTPAEAQTTQENHLGLIGLRERVEALGGELTVTSTSPTWVLQVRIPLGG